jgi:hypothetical protein
MNIKVSELCEIAKNAFGKIFLPVSLSLAIQFGLEPTDAPDTVPLV